MRLVIFLILAIVSVCGSANSQSDGYVVPYYPNEVIRYKLSVGFFPVGNALIQFKSDSLNCGSYLKAEAKSGGFAKIIKKVNYDFQCCMNPKTGLPFKSTRVVVEGDDYSVDKIYYNHEIRDDSTVVYGKRIDSMAVQKNILDILLGFYYYRANYLGPDMKVGQIDTIKTFFFREEWDLIIKYAGKETIKTKYGEIECVKIQPETEVGYYFKSKNDMTIWLSDTKLKVPVKIYVNLKVGSLTAELEGYKKPHKTKNK